MYDNSVQFVTSDYDKIMAEWKELNMPNPVDYRYHHYEDMFGTFSTNTVGQVCVDTTCETALLDVAILLSDARFFFRRSSDHRWYEFRSYTNGAFRVGETSFYGVCISAGSPDVVAEELDAYNRAHPDTRVIRCMIPQRYTTGIASTYYLN